MNSSIQEAAAMVKALTKKPQKIQGYVLTGAGASRSSNIPTFRGEDGLWEKYNFEEIATARAWKRNPKKMWEFYVEGIQVILKSQPNPTHYAITQLEEMGLCKAIITQNADGLHQRAGSKNVLEIHGNLTKVRCTKCSYSEEYKEAPKELPPKCPLCSNILRPAVVLFDEQLPTKMIDEAYKIARKANLAIIVGTSAEVIPAAYLPMLSRENNAKIIVFNTEATDHSKIADAFIQGKSEETLPKFIDLLAKN